jgi:hypothetical protein
MSNKPRVVNPVEEYILNSIQEIEFGRVEVIIHDRQIVQVEKSEKKRVRGDNIQS